MKKVLLIVAAVLLAALVIFFLSRPSDKSDDSEPNQGTLSVEFDSDDFAGSKEWD